MVMTNDADLGPMLQEARASSSRPFTTRGWRSTCIGLGEIDRAHESAVTARVAIDAAVTAVEAVLR